MKYMNVFILLLGIFAPLMPSSSTYMKIPKIKNTVSQKISTNFIEPITTYVDSSPLLTQVKNFYTNPKYHKFHSLIYGFKSPVYQKEYYNPAIDWLSDYWKKTTNNSIIHYHLNTVEPTIQQLKKSDQKKDMELIHNYYNSYFQYQTARNSQEKLLLQKKLLQKASDLTKTAEKHTPLELHI